MVVGVVRLGAAVDALFDESLARLLGLEVRGGDGAHRFLPFPACEVKGDRLAIESPLVVLDRELGFHHAGGNTFSDLRDRPVGLDGRQLGSLADLLVDEEGSVRRLVVSATAGVAEVEPGPGLVVGDHVLRPAV
ncbi:MAG: hypothetical protein ACRDLZ_01140 [Gaiellaceae bacterium]